MKTALKIITPAWAKSVLENNNTLNRPISEVRVASIARDIRSGAYLLTHQGVAFDVENTLLDGQHRLAACVLANMPIKCNVSTGLPVTQEANGVNVNTFECIDSGKTRSAGQMLQMAGYTNGNHVAAAAKAAVLFAARTPDNIGVSTSQVRKAMALLGSNLVKSVEIGRAGKIIRPPSWCVGVVACYRTREPEHADQFLRDIVDVTAPVGTAARLLANQLSSSKRTGGGSATVRSFPIVTTALWLDAQGTRAKRLYPNTRATEWLLALNPTLIAKLASIIR